MNWTIVYILAFCVSAAFAALAVRICVSLAPRLGFLDLPLHEAHKRHKQSMPVMGGIGMLAAWLLTMLGGLCLAHLNAFGDEIASYLPGIQSLWHRIGVLMLGTICVTMLGTMDDRRAMRALPKFIGQALVAGLTVALGLHVSFLHQIPGANYVFSALWIMTVMNAMNFFDNMDGLASGASLIASACLAFIAAYRGQYFVATLSSVTAGVACGFLVWNAPPARIFMGDGGSHLLGYLLAVSSILTTYFVNGESHTPAPMLIPLLVLGVPLADAVAVVLIRLKLGVPIYKGDNRHISHRFVNLGLSRPQAVLSVLLLCFMVGISSITLIWLPPAGAVFILAMVAAVFALISIIQFYVRSK